ncbi:MAG: acylphosphatase [Acidobacteria bacterium]|nr:acylphosphatase [Acidobacteriota bacterium]MBI3487406.1 acylphosphatase [Acidobacteriota bacterium]
MPTTDDPVRVAFRVHGSVQGVGYRRFAAREAQALDLVGWVRNEEDGSVCGEVEGPGAALLIFQARLKAGPPFARVDRLDWERLDWGPLDVRSSLPPSFQIRR